ncbi:TPA: hypothetical protein ACSK87_000535, partial [Listeria innocua]
MDKEKECDRTEILYHFQGDKNILASEDNIEIQKQQISSFIKREILNKNRNLNIFIGSGCSTPAIPLMGATLKTILNKSENEDIKQEFISYLNLSEDHK